MMESSSNIVVEWLHFLQLGHYARDFVENGYDDLETVKRIGPPDLDAIGVISVHHRSFLLDAVRVLREQGAAWVYLLLGTASPPSSCRSSSPRTPEQSCGTETTDCVSECSLHSVVLHRPSPIHSLQLRSLVREKIRADEIRLSASPYTSQSGDGYLANLASRYSSELGLSYPLVLQQLEDFRLAEWSDRAPPPPTVPTPGSSSESRRHIPFPNDYVNYPASDCGLPTTTLPRSREGNYVPGSYSPSSCLSERDGDQIYDYASKYRSQIRAQQAKMLMSPHSWLQMARRIISKAGGGHSRGGIPHSSSNYHQRHHPNCRNHPPPPPPNLRYHSQSEGNIAQLGMGGILFGPEGLIHPTQCGSGRNIHQYLPQDTPEESGVTVFKTKVMYHHGSEQALNTASAGGSGIKRLNSN